MATKKTKTAKTEADKYVPAKGKKAYDAFLNLLTLITLSWGLWALGATIFSIIEKYWPSAAYSTFSERSLRYSLASLIVFVPTYYILVAFLHRQYHKLKLDFNSGVRRWLTYLTLLVSALVILGSLVFLIFGYLNGDQTINVILKTLTLIVLSLLVFGYYWFDMKREDYKKVFLPAAIFAGIGGLAAVSMAIVGLLSVDSPAMARARAADSAKDTAMTTIALGISSNYVANGKLDDSVDLTVFNGSQGVVSVDGITYKKISSDTFALCTNFETAVKKNAEPNYTYPSSGYKVSWENHGKGYNCFNVNAQSLLSQYGSFNGVNSAAGKAIPAMASTSSDALIKTTSTVPGGKNNIKK